MLLEIFLAKVVFCKYCICGNHVWERLKSQLQDVLVEPWTKRKNTRANSSTLKFQTSWIVELLMFCKARPSQKSSVWLRMVFGVTLTPPKLYNILKKHGRKLQTHMSQKLRGLFFLYPIVPFLGPLFLVHRFSLLLSPTSLLQPSFVNTHCGHRRTYMEPLCVPIIWCHSLQLNN